MEARLTNKELGGGHSKWCSGNIRDAGDQTQVDPGSATYKATSLPSVLSLQPQKQII